MKSTFTWIMNGDMRIKFYTHYCKRCGVDILESAPYVNVDEYIYCCDCAFIEEYISEEYCKKCGYYYIGVNFHLDIIDGAVVAVLGKRSVVKKDKRNSPSYREWRTSVFKRDGYRCTHCGRVGGDLNAHHIKSYKNHEDLRLDINNGITLCVKCHKKEHKVVK